MSADPRLVALLAASNEMQKAIAAAGNPADGQVTYMLQQASNHAFEALMWAEKALIFDARPEPAPQAPAVIIPFPGGKPS